MKAAYLIIGAITAFIITAGGSFISVIVALNGSKPTIWSILTCVAFGLIAAGKDVRSQMALPPLSNGNLEVLKQWQAASKTVQDKPQE